MTPGFTRCIRSRQTIRCAAALFLSSSLVGFASSNQESQSRRNQVPSLIDFGAKCDGRLNTISGEWSGSDDTLAIQKAMDSGQDFFIPASGVDEGCLFSSTLRVNMPNHSFGGFGQYSGKLVYSRTSVTPRPSTTSDLVTVSQLATPSQTGNPGFGKTTIHDLSIISAIKMTAGSAIHQFNSGYIDYRNLAIGSQSPKNINDGIWFDETDYTTLIGFNFQVEGEALKVSGNGVHTGPQYDLYVAFGKIGGSTIGIHIGGGFDNAWFDSIADVFNTRNIVIDNTISPFGNQHTTFGPMFMAENAEYDNVTVDDRKCDPKNFCVLTFYGHYSVAKGGDGINIKSMPGGYIIVKAQEIQGNKNAGIAIHDPNVFLLMDQGTLITANTIGLFSDKIFTPKSLGFVSGNKRDFENINQRPSK